MDDSLTHNAPGILVTGGYGTFGQHVVRALVDRGFGVTIAGRSLARASASAQALGPNCAAVAVDVTERSSYEAVLRTHQVAVNCAGPYSTLGLGFVAACCEFGVHYVDLADDRAFIQGVRRLGPRFAERNLTAAFGCSSLPGISGALAHVARETSSAAVTRARVTLFIGNNNDKGAAAVASAVRQLGRPITAPQGTLVGFRDSIIAPLPSPFEPRRVLNFESADFDLLPLELGAQSVEVKVGFESRLATSLFYSLAGFAPALGRWLLPKLRVLNPLVRHFGSTGGVVMTELEFADGTKSSAALVARENGQRMAALPAALVATRLARGECPRGAVTAYQTLGARELLEELKREGFELLIR